MDFQYNCFKKRQIKTKKSKIKTRTKEQAFKMKKFFQIERITWLCIDSKYAFLVEMRNAPLFGKVLSFQKLNLTASWNQSNLWLTWFSFIKTICSSRLLGVVFECFGLIVDHFGLFLIFSLAVVCCFGVFWDAVDCCGS